MKLKLVIDGSENPDDFKLLHSTIGTIAALRENAVLRFTKEYLIIISTPQLQSDGYSRNNKGSLGSGGSDSSGGKGQLWCTLPRDVFQAYFIEKANDNPITLEFNCTRLFAVLQRYERSLSQGSTSEMNMQLQGAKDWQQVYQDNANGKPLSSQTPNKKRKMNPIYSFTMRFQEIVKTGGNSNRNNDMSNNNGNNLENNYYSTTSTLHPTGVTKTVNHKFKIPVKQLTTRQNDSLVEPQLERIPIILNLPSSQEEFGKPFLSFMKRIERHNGLKNIQLNAIEYANDDNEYNDSSLSISVDQRGWKVAIKWNIPLTKATIAEENNNEKKGEEQDSAIVHEKRQEDQAYARSHKGSNYDHNENINGSSNNNNYGNSPMIITPMEYNKGKSRYEFEDDPLEDSSMNSTGMIYGDTPKPSKLSREIHQDSEEENDPLEDISRLVENAEKESQVTHSIRVRPKDWKVCSKLYAGFDSVILAIVHDQCCVLHCSLDRGDEPSQVTQEGDSVSSVQRREKGQIIYYMLKSQSLLES